MRRFALMFAVVVGVLAAAPTLPAVAQSSSEVAAARRLFRQGLGAARAGEWQSALELFERSYAIVPRDSTLLNLAGAQAQTGQLVAATESYRRFLAEAEGRARRYRPQAEAALAELEPRLAHLVIRVDGLRDGDVVQLGDRELAAAVLGVDLPVDPGRHTLAVRRGEETVAERALALAEGEAREVTLDAAVSLEVAAAPADPAAEAPDAAFEPDPPSDGGDDGAVIIGVSVGVAAAVAIAATIVTVVLVDQAAQPYQGSVGEGVLTFD